MHMPESTGGDFAPPPEGTHRAVCYRVVDLGTQTSDWQGEKKHQHKVLISWELPDELMAEGEHAGKPFTIHKRYTLSGHENSNMRKDLESWRGKKFQDSDFGPSGFQIQSVIGAPCMLQVLHNTNNGNTYANVDSIMQLPKGMDKPEPINAGLYFSLDDFDQAIFDGLSNGVKKAIESSPEYQKMTGTYVPDDPDASYPGPDEEYCPF